MKKTIRNLIAAIVLIAAAFLPTARVFADEEKPDIWLQISPVANRVTLDPGAELTYKMEVDNIGGKKFKFRVYATPYTIANEAYEVNFTEETNRTQISRWISFNQNMSAEKDSDKRWQNEVTFEIEPNARQDVEYKITVPSDIPEGGQYATIFAESIPEEEATATGVRAISRVGMILYGATSGNTVESAEISNLKTSTFLTKGKITSEVDIKNTGNTDFNAVVSMKVEKLIGGTVAEFDKPYPVIPDAPTRHAVIEWDDTPTFGIFKVKTTVKAIDQTVEEEKIILVLPIWIIVIMLVLLTIIIAWLIILIRKRRAQKSRLIV